MTNTERKILDQAALSLGTSEEIIIQRNQIPSKHRSMFLPARQSWHSYDEFPKDPYEKFRPVDN